MAYGSNVLIKLGFARGEGALIQSQFKTFAPGVVAAWK